jgi:hypothetical protein
MNEVKSTDIPATLNAYLLENALFWKEDKYLEISPGQDNKFLSVMYDEHAKSCRFLACEYTWGKPETLRLT